MSRKNLTIAVLCLLALSACATTQPPVVSLSQPPELLMREPARPEQIPLADQSAPNSAPSELKLSDVGTRWAQDMVLVRELREQVIALQDWIRGQLEASR